MILLLFANFYYFGVILIVGVYYTGSVYWLGGVVLDVGLY